MTEAAAPQQFADALKALYEAAGSPPYALLVHQAARRRSPVKLTESTLSDWLNGTSVPESQAKVTFLVEFLSARITEPGYRPRDLVWWTALHTRARQAKQAARGGRPPIPRTRPPSAAEARLGRLVGECDPVELEVHRAITVPGQDRSLPVLPVYVPRGHDARLDEILVQVAAGASHLVTLVGGSSTGKTRACWELVQRLDAQQPGQWRLWHPYDPTRPDAALADLDRVSAYTIVWLNEAQHYLAPPDDRLGERIAARLRTLLQDPQRRPVLVLATIWQEPWHKLTTRPEPGEPDPYAQARDLLTGTSIEIGDVFAPGEIAELEREGVDPRLREAAVQAEGGRITQYLAGAPDLVNRYRMARPAARAIIQVAMDARRLGYPPALPHTLLEQAAPGYLDDHDWDHAGEDWLEQALAYAAQPCKGARGPLTRSRTRPGDPPSRDGSQDGQPRYWLSDYLDQVGRAERSGTSPPDSFWQAAATVVTNPRLLRHLGKQAEALGRHNDAVALLRKAADRSDVFAMTSLAWLRVREGDTAGAEALFKQGALYAFADLQQHHGDRETAEAVRQYAADYPAGESSPADSGTTGGQTPAGEPA